MNLKALIIDDEIQIRRLLRVALEGAGYDVHEAESGSVGFKLRRALRHYPDAGACPISTAYGSERLREWSQLPRRSTVRTQTKDKVPALYVGVRRLRDQALHRAELWKTPRGATPRPPREGKRSVFP